MTENSIHAFNTQLFSANIQIKSFLLIVAFSNIPLVIHHHSDFSNIILLGKNLA